MKSDIEHKLEKMEAIWDNFILEYSDCSNQIEFNEEVKTNYIIEIFTYFKDTLDIIFSLDKGDADNIEKLSYIIALLQSIYVQQDLIKELLTIFKITISNEDLKKDLLYIQNRNLRNELIGHPINRNDRKLISSTLFAHIGKYDIKYLRYSKDSGFSTEIQSCSIKCIKDKHKFFLEKYLDIILIKLREILNNYLLVLENLEQVIEGQNFDMLLKFVELHFESIFESDYLYDKNSLEQIYNSKDKHPRYQNLIDKFYIDLKESILEVKNNILNFDQQKLVNEQENNTAVFPIEIEVIYPGSDKAQELEKDSPISYTYEIGKLASKRNLSDFQFFSSSLKHKCQNNPIIIRELQHMEQNIDNVIEYHTALELIEKELNDPHI